MLRKDDFNKIIWLKIQMSFLLVAENNKQIKFYINSWILDTLKRFVASLLLE